MRAVAGLWTLNAIDAASSWAALRAGWAEEANPLMARCFQLGPAFGVAFKIFLMTLCVAWLVENWQTRTAQRIAVISAAVYSTQVMWQAVLWAIVTQSGVQ